ncbi:DUF488 domain-containing protein [Salinimicrobium tongyeongense]|uniref:DUF488 domain-containing protein n=1 Tax=Salinimicrobium tongyeongense TaxID=2809707 RepID=A0ABY6NUY1_9FLAO|nr:DUF488 domain-containing protein [Salinimicrobium tongyeongense]UZH56720.1 DUF488 domain-containing protein [Salinimicrobium tongyeongense]
MEKTSLYTIGHGNKDLKDFIQELENFFIEYVFDVRSRPVSNFCPHFNRPVLEYELAKKGITYVFLGDYLGGLPKDKSCFTNGRVDYKKVRDKDFFKEGIRLLIEAHEADLKIALMCSERKPEECHRSKLIGQELLYNDISINHITPEGLKKQEKIISELTNGQGLKDLFGVNDFTSRKEYL